MVAVAHDFVCPFSQEVSHGLFVVHVQAPACLLAPADIAQLVCPIIVTLLEDFLVQTCAVEAHSLAHLDVMLECLITWRGPNAVGIVALVEHEALEVGFIIEVEVAACKVNLAHACIGLHFVQDVALGVTNHVLHIVKVRLFWPPEFRVLDGQHDDRVVCGRSCFRRYNFLAVKHLDG